MTVYHIFYDSNKDIAWSSTAGVTDAMKTEQKTTHNYDYVQIDHSETPVGEKYYIDTTKHHTAINGGIPERIHLLGTVTGPC